jgi:membrane protein YqaA with SNARE-associated domain
LAEPGTGAAVTAGEPETTNAGLLRQCRATFDRWERFTSNRHGTTLMFVWAVAEATVWPVIPEFLLVPMAADNRRRFFVPLAAAALGAAIGGVLLVLFASCLPYAAVDALGWLPLVPRAQVEEAERQLAAEGARAFVVQPWSGVPFKVWGLVAGIEGIDPWLTIPAFIAGRTARMALFATLARVLTGFFRGFVRDFSLYVLAIYVVLFT